MQRTQRRWPKSTEDKYAPLVTISTPEGKSDEYCKTVANQVNEAVLDTLDFPPDDRYQLVREFPSRDLELQERER
ncbi:tautomerase family protein [Halobacterium sp. KA-6]|uniref:tautomerase family protein n=1 Tax=Halobacterium sp. KA-6 TaxID=2896368 RepID=UPI003FA57112